MIKVSEAEGKDPLDTDDFSIDWINYLSNGETIVTPTATSSDVTVAAVSASGTRSTARLSGGTPSQDATIHYSITTSLGRVLNQTLTLPIRTQ
jgi:hypothetical protein